MELLNEKDVDDYAKDLCARFEIFNGNYTKGLITNESKTLALIVIEEKIATLKMFKAKNDFTYKLLDKLYHKTIEAINKL